MLARRRPPQVMEAYLRRTAFGVAVKTDLGADPFLVGVAAELGYTVVSQETPAGSRRKKVKVPDACAHLGVSYEDTFEMMRSLGARFG